MAKLIRRLSTRTVETLSKPGRHADGTTFEECASAYIDLHQHGWRNPKHLQQWRNTLVAYAHPVFGAVPVDEIDTELVLRMLQPIWREKPETASRLRGRIEAVLDWAKARGYREGENPARSRGHMEQLLPRPSKVASVKHRPALPFAEVPSFIRELRNREGIAALALEFTILTAARSGEVREATWSEIDLRGGVWTAPAERMKAGRMHRVPLSSRAVEILERVRRLARVDDDYLFPGQKLGKPLSDMTLTAVLRRMGRGDLTVHGFRSTFRDWAGQRFPREVCEMALAHTVRNKVEVAYARSDVFERRIRPMEESAMFCEGGAPSV